MIKLRLKRFGKKKEASFRIVACNSTSRRDGRPLQELGFYNPRTKETRLDTEALRTRLTQGAQPSDVVRTLLEKGGLLEKKERPSIAIGKSKLEMEKLAKIKNLEHVTNIFFNQRRKKIKKPMKQLFKNYEDVAQKLDLKLNLRPQNISKNKFVEICKFYEKLS